LKEVEMSERRHGEKQEKREKEDANRTEKQAGEKWVRDPVRGISMGVILIWGGIVAYLSVGNIITVSWWQGWAVFLAGTGAILLIKAAVRLMPEYRRPIGGTIIIGVILLGVGIGDIVGWTYTWPIILIVIGVLIVGQIFLRRR
jgi:fatty acid desaturase